MNILPFLIDPFSPGTNGTPGPRRGHWLIGSGLLVLGALLILIIALGFLFVRFNTYRNSSSLIIDTGFPQITIKSPADGATLSLGSPVIINVAASGPNPFQQVELLIDGVVSRVEAAPTANTTFFEVEFDWTPNEPGAHQLVARATDNTARLQASAAVLTIVSPEAPLPKPDEISEEITQPDSESESNIDAVVQPSIDFFIPNFAPAAAGAPDPGDVIGTGKPWTGTPGNWITNLTTQSAPSPPNLVGATGTCGANLTFQDVSDNEEGFRIYRSDLNAANWTQIAQLAAESQPAWLTFADSNIAGQINYYVTAFNSQGESGSNIVLVNIGSADCPPPESNVSTFVELTHLSLNTPAEQKYCYISLGDDLWGRWPNEGFLNDSEGKIELVNPIFPISLDGEPPSDQQGSRFLLECWGWLDGSLDLIGKFDIEPPEGGYGTVDLSTLDAFIELTFFEFDPATMQTLESDNDIPFPYQLYLRKPWVTNLSSIDFGEGCLLSVDLDVVGPGYCNGDRFGTKKVPGTPFDYEFQYVFWAPGFKNDCVISYTCFYPPDLHFFGLRDEVVNGEFGFNVYMTAPAVGLTKALARSFPSPNHLVYVPPGWVSSSDCSGKLDIGVSSYFIPTGSDQMFESETVWKMIPEPCPVEDSAIMELELKQLWFHGITEEPGVGEWLDINAGFFLLPNWDGNALYLAKPPEQTSANCPAPDGVAPDDAGQYAGECPLGVVDTKYQVSNLLLCYGPILSESCSEPFSYSSNSLFFTAYNPGDGPDKSPPLFGFAFRDHDTNSATDEFCEGSLQLPAQSFAEWSDPSDQSYEITVPFNGIAGCTINIKVRPWRVFNAP